MEYAGVDCRNSLQVKDLRKRTSPPPPQKSTPIPNNSKKKRAAFAALQRIPRQVDLKANHIRLRRAEILKLR